MPRDPMTFEDHPTLWIPLPDGTRLAARIWRPATDTPVPAVLEYLPYRRRDGTAQRDESTYPAFAEAGIAGVRVDLRGTGDSGGLFDDEYSETELSDAEAVIAWIADQPWCNGHVGMMGISWGGFNALQLAARRPPALKAVISIASTVDRFADDIHYKGGAMMSANLYWATQMLGRVARAPDADVVGEAWRDIWQQRLDGIALPIRPWTSHQRRDAYWQHGSICEDFQALDAPALVIAGWADGYRNTPWDARRGLGETARAMTGPWVHLYPHFASPAPRLDFLGEAIAWWQAHLTDTPRMPDLPAHRLWLAEAVRPEGDWARQHGRWIAIDQQAGSETRLHLSARGLHADPEAPAPCAIQTPLDCGLEGGEYFTQGGRADLPGDQRRDDGLSTCFDTAPLTAPLDIIGRPELRLPVALDAPQGNLVARLCDVHPDGTSHRISLGVLNLSHRAGSAAPRPMVPGESEEITLTLDATAYRLRPGHRLRLALSTAYFPLILPPPGDVTATIETGPRATLHLPHAPYRDITLPEGRDTRPDYPRQSPAAENREIHHDRSTNRSTVTITSDTGRLAHPGHGLEWQETHRATWAITRGDPLSLEGIDHYTGTRWRNGVATSETAMGRLRVEEGNWIIEAAIEAREDGDIVFSRDWSFRVPRDHI
ncbi:MAG: CocE/NonD family hydrolase [Silicimonas sp.]|nr:CocE/NonD family hydrolase [Silicimonas sp.]